MLIRIQNEIISKFFFSFACEMLWEINFYIFSPSSHLVFSCFTLLFCVIQKIIIHCVTYCQGQFYDTILLYFFIFFFFSCASFDVTHIYTSYENPKIIWEISIVLRVSHQVKTWKRKKMANVSHKINYFEWITIINWDEKYVD